MRDKKVIIIGGVLAIFVAGVVFYLLSTKPAINSNVVPVVEEEIIDSLTPQEVGLDLFPTKNNRYITFTLDKLDGISQIEYEISYNATVEDNVVLQGLNGEVGEDDINKGTVTVERILGTCSTGGKCRFDEGVTGAKILLKITKTNGKVYQVEKSIDF